MPLDPYAPPQEEAPRSRALPSLLPGEMPRGSIVAGGVLCANAVLVLIERALTLAPSEATMMNGILPVMIDIAIGVALLLRKTQVRAWAIVRCIVGGVLFAGMRLAAADLVSVAFQLAVTGSLLALLLGNPGKPRIAIACGVFALYALVEMVGIAALAAR